MGSTRPTVLIVDDDADTLEMYDVALSLDGFRPLTTRQFSIVALLIRALKPHAVVMDPRGDDGDGWALIQSLKQAPGTPRTPVVVVTSSTKPAIAQRAEELGCATVLTKPCLPDALAEALRTVIAS